MLSFIIIGHNEGWKITKCFQSVFDTIEYNKLSEYEVIYVDSKSTDDSIKRVKSFKFVRIFQISGVCNAAIARNIGAEEAKGSILFFIDGDMEIIPEFLKLVYNENNGLLRDFISGQLKNYNYNLNGKFENNSWQYKNVLKKDSYSITTGGIFIIIKNLWDLVSGMNPIFKRGQDLDFSLQLSKKGSKIFRKKEIIANHHTVSYQHTNRMWKTLFTGDILFARSLLYRKHFFNKYMYRKIIRTDYSLLILLLSLLFSMFTQNCYSLIAYLLIVLFRVFKSKNSIKTKLQLLIYFPIRDLITFFGFFFFYPKINITINYKKV